ncbi:MAG: holo-ACP synthase [Candidatus Saccharimonadales bacterium]
MVGIDILALEEFKKQLETGGDPFLRRVYAEHELENREPVHLAGIFCAKEAVLKAVGIEPGGWPRIAIKYQANGKPFAEVDGRIIPVSISHHGQYAVAVAMDLP